MQQLLSAWPPSEPSALLVKCEHHLRKLADPQFWFAVAVREEMATGIDRQTAVQKVANADPTLHHKYLLACNPDPNLQRMVIDKFHAEVDAAGKKKHRTFSGGTIRGVVAELKGVADMLTNTEMPRTEPRQVIRGFAGAADKLSAAAA